MIKVKLTGDRMDLNEGRAYGLAFAMAKKVADGKFETVNTLSTCKDYLNDVIFIERFTKDGAISVFGLKYKHQGIFEQNGTGYLYIQPLGFRGNNGGWADKENMFDINIEIFNLTEKIPFIIESLHNFEDLMGFKTNTSVDRTENKGGFIFTVPAEWTSSPYMISLYSLMIRSMQYVDTSNPFYHVLSLNPMDANLLASARRKVDFLLKTKELPVYPTAANPKKQAELDGHGIHNGGINSWYLSADKKFLGCYATSNNVIIQK